MRSSLAYIIVMSLLVSACGWQLRGMQAERPLPNIEVVSKDQYSAMARSVREALQKHNGNGDGDGDADANYKLQILKEELDKRPVTYNANGTPAQYEMSLTLTYAIQRYGATEPDLPRQTATHRIFDFDPRNVVAKSEEERDLLQQMRRQVAQRLISEISRLHSSPGNGAPPRGTQPQDTPPLDTPSQGTPSQDLPPT